jgi:membrane-bound lytic murein transglycosylase D
MSTRRTLSLALALAWTFWAADGFVQAAPASSSSSPSSGPSVTGVAPAPSSSATSPAASARPSQKAASDASSDVDALFEFGRQLFEDYAPEQVREHFEFPSAAQWRDFTGRLQRSLEEGSLENLGALEPEARRTLATLRLMPEYSDYADWLAERLDLMETAREATQVALGPVTPPAASPPTVPFNTPAVPSPEPNPVTRVPDTPSVTFKAETKPSVPVPFYDLWLARMRGRPKPPRADELMPLLKVIFASEGLPPELVWLAEVESSLNPNARSPAGARGLFQLMPATARSLGLSLLPFDERAQPGKNARAAARLLRALHERFESWPLALAAYNAGEGRIAVALKKNQAERFADIADALPAETRMYVPKVLATLAVRENVTLDKLAPPGPPQAWRRSPPTLTPAIIVAAP